MSLKTDFEQQLKSQMDVWQSQIKDYQQQMQKAGESAKAGYAQSIAMLEAKSAEARQMFERVRSASESAWDDMHKANQKAFAEMQKGWADALSRFK